MITKREKSRVCERVGESARECERVRESARVWERVGESGREWERVRESAKECERVGEREANYSAIKTYLYRHFFAGRVYVTNRNK